MHTKAKHHSEGSCPGRAPSEREERLSSASLVHEPRERGDAVLNPGEATSLKSAVLSRSSTISYLRSLH